MKAFRVDVANLIEAKLLLNTLAEYDFFQFKNGIKPNYSNAGGLQVFDEEFEGGEFIDWYSDDGEEFDKYSLEDLRADGCCIHWEGIKT